MAVKSPSSTFSVFASRPGRSICVDVQRKGGIIIEPQLLTKKTTAPIQLRAHGVVVCNVVVAFPSDQFPDVSFPQCFSRIVS